MKGGKHAEERADNREVKSKQNFFDSNKKKKNKRNKKNKKSLLLVLE